MNQQETIIALATPSGSGAIGVIRISGGDAIALVTPCFKSIHGKDLKKQKTHTIHLGQIIEGKKILDEVLVSVFKGPNSYTGEDVVEISCHGSTYIQQQVIQLFLRNGCRTAEAGEFTLRAFLNGKLDLSQAEAVADLIASDNEASHQIAMQQMRGGFSSEIKKLRQELLNFASLIELELDFSEEDVEFANRSQFRELLSKIEIVLKRLIDSFAVGNVIKNGIPVAIVGEPNVGKSTLLNKILNEERALVSNIAGTTRDTIEDEITIDGIGFRFIDTAGIRDTSDIVEGMGIKRTFDKIEESNVILYMFDAQNYTLDNTIFKNEIEQIRNKYPLKPLITLANKIDTLEQNTTKKLKEEIGDLHLISAKENTGVEELKSKLKSLIDIGALKNGETIITNTRHYSSLSKALQEIKKIQLGLENNLSSDLISIDIRQALHYFGEITGEISSDDLLGNIFANFCIGK
ncbi:tRNA uridine-5-carboxymethylaminomethyl(34) synthesis GTPase MnmE [Croceitalea marina]|uniref:tRNA modification GTPase MnmE n=1 Tax=Croceitalea marina TaxID=1775166 RepID=A0ABW5MVE4_9FLAO